MGRRPGSGKTPRQAPDTSSLGSGIDRQAKPPRLALAGRPGPVPEPADDAQLDRLAEAVIDEVCRRGRSVPRRLTANAGSPNRTPAKAARAKPDRPATVTAGQERLILAAFDAGLRPAAIAKEFRVSRSEVQHVITDAKRGSRRTER